MKCKCGTGCDTIYRKCNGSLRISEDFILCPSCSRRYTLDGKEDGYMLRVQNMDDVFKHLYSFYAAEESREINRIQREEAEQAWNRRVKEDEH